MWMCQATHEKTPLHLSHSTLHIALTCVYVIWLIYMWNDLYICDVTHMYLKWLVYMWYNSYVCEIRSLVYVWYDSYVCEMTCIYVIWLICMRNTLTCIFVICLICMWNDLYMCNMIQMCMSWESDHHSCMHVACLIMCATAHMWLTSFKCVCHESRIILATCMLHASDHYGVATISRLHKIIGLFCKI